MPAYPPLLKVFTLVAGLLFLTACDSYYVDSGQSVGSYDSRSLALGDVDKDGDLDLAVANRDQGNRVYNYEEDFRAFVSSE